MCYKLCFTSVGFSCSPTLHQTCLEEKKDLIYCRIWLIQLEEGKEVLGLGSFFSASGLHLWCQWTPAQWNQFQSDKEDQEMGFAPSPSTDSGAFHLNAGNISIHSQQARRKLLQSLTYGGYIKTAVRKSPGAVQTWALPWVLQSREKSGSGCNKSMLEILCPVLLLITVSSCKWNNPKENRSHSCHVTEEEVKTHLHSWTVGAHRTTCSWGRACRKMGLQAKSRSLCQLSHGSLCNYLNCHPRFLVQ